MFALTAEGVQFLCLNSEHVYRYYVPFLSTDSRTKIGGNVPRDRSKQFLNFHFKRSKIKVIGRQKLEKITHISCTCLLMAVGSCAGWVTCVVGNYVKADL